MNNHILILIARNNWLMTTFLLAVVVSILSMIGFSGIAVDIGHNIPQGDLATDYIIAVIWAIALGVSILVWPVRDQDRRSLLVLWSIKLLVTLGVMLFYEANYETLDAYAYFANSRQGDSSLLEEVRIGAGTQNIIALSWLHNQLLPDSYHALKITFSMIGLIAVYLFYRTAVMFLRCENIRIFYILALFPSILFWSSILGKEPIVLFGMALYVYGVVGWHYFKRLRYLFFLACGVILAIFIRQWLGPILLLPLLIFAMQGIKNVVFRVMFIFLTIAACLLLISQFMERISIKTIQDLLETTDKISRAWAIGGSAQEVNVDFTRIGSMLAFAPIGVFTALFRPLPGEIFNPFALLAGLENIALLGLLFLAIKRARWKDIRNPLVLWAISLVAIWATVYGFVSYQNLGTAVRYKLQILPMLVGLLLYLARRRSKASMF